MTAPSRKYWRLLWLAAPLAFIAAVAGSQPEESQGETHPARPMNRDATHSSSAHGDARLPLELLNRPLSDPDTVNLFASKSWYVPPPPPPPPKPLPPPPPTAPPLPFTYLGKYQDQGAQQIFFLVKGDRLYSVPAGEIIDGTYRVDGVSGSQLGLTYLPLNIKQSIFIGES